MGIHKANSVVMGYSLCQFGVDLQDEHQVSFFGENLKHFTWIIRDFTDQVSTQIAQDMPANAVVLTVGIAISDDECF